MICKVIMDKMDTKSTNDQPISRASKILTKRCIRFPRFLFQEQVVENEHFNNSMGWPVYMVE